MQAKQNFLCISSQQHKHRQGRRQKTQEIKCNVLFIGECTGLQRLSEQSKEESKIAIEQNEITHYAIIVLFELRMLE